MGSLARGSRERLGDRLFAELFRREIDRKIDRAELLLSGILAYIRAAVPSAGPCPLRIIVEEAVAHCSARAEEKRVPLSVQCDDALVRTSVPEEQLRYLIDAALRIALDLASPGSGIEAKVTVPGQRMTRQPTTEPGGSDAVTVAITVNEVSRRPGTSQALAAMPHLTEDLGREPEVCLLAELSRVHGATFSASLDPTGGRAVLSLVLPAAGQQSCPPG